MSREGYICSVIERYLSGNASEMDRELIKMWLESNSEFAEWLREEIITTPAIIDISDKDRIYRNVVGRSLPKDFQEDLNTEPTDTRRHTSGQRHLLSIAAGIAFIMIGYVFSEMIHKSDSGVTFTVTSGVGERPTVLLPDGTEVNLNALSRLSYTFQPTSHCREINLSGEAYFNVEPDADSPFRVHTPNITVECLGTEFNIKAYPTDEQETVVLTDGKVRVDWQSGKEILSPNSMITYRKVNHTIAKTRVHTDSYTDWTRGYIYFNNQSINDVSNDIYRNYGIRLDYDSELASMKFCGTICCNNVFSVMDVLADATEATYTICNDSTILLSRH